MSNKVELHKLHSCEMYVCVYCSHIMHQEKIVQLTECIGISKIYITHFWLAVEITVIKLNYIYVILLGKHTYEVILVSYAILSYVSNLHVEQIKIYVYF